MAEVVLDRVSSRSRDGGGVIADLSLHVAGRESLVLRPHCAPRRGVTARVRVHTARLSLYHPHDGAALWQATGR